MDGIALSMAIYGLETDTLMNGMVTMDVPGYFGLPASSYAMPGETVTLTVTPDVGYVLEPGSLQVNSDPYHIDGSGDPYTFTMPEADATVTAQFSSLFASRGSGAATQYYTSLQAAIDDSSGSAASPDVITLLMDITITNDYGSGQAAAACIVIDGKHVKLVGNAAHTITRGVNGLGSLIQVRNGSLVLDGSQPLSIDGGSTGIITANGSLIHIESGTLTMGAGVTLQNNDNSVTGTVHVSDGTFTMTGGSISGNKAAAGGGVYMVDNGSTFTMTGGSISGNKAAAGGGVHMVGNGSTFTMTGGSIRSNEASNCGGGVSVGDCTFIMSGGSITGNFITGTDNYSRGGGVYVDNGSFTMSDTAEITLNHAYIGGGVWSNGTFEMNGGSIAENYTTGSYGGGGVCMNGNFTMTSGTIKRNSSDLGGGVYVNNGAFEMSGGSIIGNEASGTASFTGGGGVYVSASGTFEMSAGTISNNTATSYGASLYKETNGTACYGGLSGTGNILTGNWTNQALPYGSGPPYTTPAPEN
jgi:hypothetical protein